MIATASAPMPERTVRAHLTEVFHALGVRNRTQALLQAQKLGLIT